MSIKVEEQQTKMQNFRFGQGFTLAKASYMWRRTAYANFWVSKVVKKSIKGLVFKDVGSKDKAKWSDDAVKWIKSQWKDVIKGIEFQREGGKSSFIMVEDVENSKEVLLRSFRMNKYQISYNKSGNINSFEAIESIGGINADTITHKFEGDKLKKYVYELIINETDTKGEGISEMEACWDTFIGLMMLDASGTYFVIRNGSGVPISKVPMSLMSDSEFMEIFDDAIVGIGSPNDAITIPTSDNPDEAGVSFDFVQADQMDFLALRDLLLGSLAVITSYPREGWLGSELGLRSGETNKKKQDGVHQEIQNMYRNTIEWIINTANMNYEWFPEGNKFEIDYESDIAISLEEKLIQFRENAELAQKLGYDLDIAEVIEILGLKLTKKEPLDLVPKQPIDDDGKEKPIDDKDKLIGDSKKEEEETEEG